MTGENNWVAKIRKHLNDSSREIEKQKYLLW